VRVTARPLVERHRHPPLIEGPTRVIVVQRRTDAVRVAEVDEVTAFIDVAVMLHTPRRVSHGGAHRSPASVSSCPTRYRVIPNSAAIARLDRPAELADRTASSSPRTSA